MKAVQFSEYRNPEVLQVVDVDEPYADPGQVRIAVRAAGVNPSDWKRMAGKYRDHEEVTFPSGLGVEGSGIVDEVGPGVSNVCVGDAVFGCGEHTMAMAQYAVLSCWAHKPDELSFEVAGGLPVIADTATRAGDDICLAIGGIVHGNRVRHFYAPSMSVQSVIIWIRKSGDHAPHGVEAFFAMPLGMGRILSHEVHGRFRHRVRDCSNESSRGLAHGTIGATALHQFGDARHHLAGGHPSLRRDFVGYTELCQRAPFLGVGDRPIGPVLPYMKELFAEVRISRKPFHGGERYLPFQFKVKCVEEVFLRLEVGEERSVGNSSFFRDACRRRAQALDHDDAGRRRQNRTSLLVTPRPRHIVSV